MNRILQKVRDLAKDFFVRPELIFIVLIIPFGFLSAIFVPHMSVADETSHFQRSYELSELRLVCGESTKEPRDIYIKLESGRAINIPGYSFYNGFRRRVNYDDLVEDTCRSASGYSPIMYVPQVIGIWLAKLIYPSPGVIVLAGRLVNLLFYAVMIFFIIKKIKVGKWALLVIALLPQMVHGAASLSADGVSNIAAIAVVAFFINLFHKSEKISKSEVVKAIGLAVLCGLTKPSNIVLLLPVAFLPTKLFNRNKNRRIPFNANKWMLVAGTFAAGIVMYILWQRTSGVSLGELHVSNLLNPIKDIYILINTYFDHFGDIIIRGMIGEFSSFMYHLPSIIWVFAIILILSSLLYKDKRECDVVERDKQRRTMLVFLSTFVAFILVTTAILYLTWAVPVSLGDSASYADGVQGRYFTAVLILLIPVFIPIKKYIKIDFKNASTIGKIIFFSMLAMLLFYTYLTFKFYLGVVV